MLANGGRDSVGETRARNEVKVHRFCAGREKAFPSGRAHCRRLRVAHATTIHTHAYPHSITLLQINLIRIWQFYVIPTIPPPLLLHSIDYILYSPTNSTRPYYHTKKCLHKDSKVYTYFPIANTGYWIEYWSLKLEFEFEMAGPTIKA